MNKRYKIIEQLSCSKMSEVYLAIDRELARKWTIKKMLCTDEVVRECIFNEMNSMKKFHDRRVSAIRECFIEGEKVCLVMEYIEGVELGKIIRDEPELAHGKALEWGIQIAQIISMLHKNTPSIIYRDLKPQNIILQPNGMLCLIDFGAAKIKTDNAYDRYAVGTKGYAAPEQENGMSDERSDIYTFGKTLGKICGKNKIFGIGKVISRCTAARDKRYRTMDEVVKALKILEIIHRWKKVLLAAGVLSVLAAALVTDYFSVKMEMSHMQKSYIEEIARIDKEYLHMALKSGKAEEALENINKYEIKNNAGLGELYLQCGMAAFTVLNDYEKAAGYFEKAEDGSRPEIAIYKEISYKMSGFSDRNSLMKLIDQLKERQKITKSEYSDEIIKKAEEVLNYAERKD